MKNLLKFFAVLVLSAGVSLLYDYQLHHGRLNLSDRKTPGNYAGRERDGRLENIASRACRATNDAD
jgi:hypothetical protein